MTITDHPLLDEWIEREFAGHGRAIRRKDEAPFPDEPYMSMVDAKELTRRAVATFASSVSPKRILLSRCYKRRQCGFAPNCICDVDPTDPTDPKDPKDVAAWVAST